METELFNNCAKKDHRPWSTKDTFGCEHSTVRVLQLVECRTRSLDSWLILS